MRTFVPVLFPLETPQKPTHAWWPTTSSNSYKIEEPWMESETVTEYNESMRRR